MKTKNAIINIMIIALMDSTLRSSFVFIFLFFLEEYTRKAIPPIINKKGIDINKISTVELLLFIFTVNNKKLLPN